MASQTRGGITNAATDAERAALLAEGESLVKAHDRLRLTPANVTDEGVTSSTQVRQSVSVSIAQSAASVTGEFTANDLSGAFAAAVSGTDISGTLTLRGSDGCAATAKMSGLVDASELRLNVPWVGDEHAGGEATSA
jgi:hypothetical protein